MLSERVEGIDAMQSYDIELPRVRDGTGWGD
jgi:hypothetical protein